MQPVQLYDAIYLFLGLLKPDFYQIDVFGKVDRRGSKKDWVHEYTSGIVNFTNNSPDIIIEDISIKNEKR